MISTVDNGTSTVSPTSPKAPPPAPLTEPSTLCSRGEASRGADCSVLAAVSMALSSASCASVPTLPRQLAGRRAMPFSSGLPMKLDSRAARLGRSSSARASASARRSVSARKIGWVMMVGLRSVS